MKKKCKSCGIRRNTEYEYLSKTAEVCVFCNDKSIFDSNYMEKKQ